MRTFVKYKIPDILSFKNSLLHYAKDFPRCCILKSNNWVSNSQDINSDGIEMIVAVDSIDEVFPSKNSFEELELFQAKKKDWLFGFLSYDLKNEIENLSSGHFDGIGFHQMHFFQPKYIFRIAPTRSQGEGVLEIGFLTELSTEEETLTIFQKINNQLPPTTPPSPISKIEQRISEKEYIQTVKKIKDHIHRGDIYEMNYCLEFFSENAEISPAEVFQNLNETSQTPFSAFYRMDDKYLLCASPERFLKKSGRKIISQPIKGTSKRGRNNSEDIEIKKMLALNEKEKSENVMIVDLVRNDLSKTCDNVRVSELFGIYTFKQWHQMISTVIGELRDDIHFSDILKNSFPMGSMTGAPKIRAMELIERYEKTKRGLYSGAVGYITPPLSRGMKFEDGADFDFNVVIRSILYNSESKYLSFQVGSAITSNSIPENEYKECLLKAKGMFEALKINTNNKLNFKGDPLNSHSHA